MSSSPCIPTLGPTSVFRLFPRLEYLSLLVGSSIKAEAHTDSTWGKKVVPMQLWFGNSLFLSLHQGRAFFSSRVRELLCSGLSYYRFFQRCRETVMDRLEGRKSAHSGKEAAIRLTQKECTDVERACSSGRGQCWRGPRKFLVKNEMNRVKEIQFHENNLEKRPNLWVEQSLSLHVTVENENFSCRLTANDPTSKRGPPPYERFNFHTQCYFTVKLESGTFKETSRCES